MSAADLVIHAGLVILHVLVALHPPAFRRSFGAAILAESTHDLKGAARAGVFIAARATVDAIGDALRGLAAEWSDVINGKRRAMLNALASDLRHAVRVLVRDRGFTTVAIGTLSLGLALCAAVSVLVNAYLVRGLPYPASDRLFDVQYGAPGLPPPRDLEKLDWKSLDDVLDVQIAWDLDNFSLRGAPYPELVQGTWVTPGYVEGFRVQPALGRGFSPTDFETGRPNVAVISHALWQRRFNGDPAILGKTFDAYVSDRPDEFETFTIVGVLSAAHWHLNPFTEVLAPLRAPTFPYVVRLKKDVAAGPVAERINAMIRRANASLPEGWRAELVATQARYVQQIKPLLLAVATATALVLLIAYANVGVLLTVRATARRQEIAVRQAIGASAGQVTRAILAEPIILGSVATVAGLAVAWVTISAIGPSLDHYLGRGVPGGSGRLTLDAATLAATVAAGLLAIVICTLIPLVVARRTPVSLVLTSGQKGGTEPPAQRRARGVMIAVEIAACLTLLVGAALTIQSAVGILRVDMGLDADNVLVGRFALRQRAYPDLASRAVFYERALASAGGISGAEGVAFTTSWPLQQALPRNVSAEPSGAAVIRAEMVGVTPDYFKVVRIPSVDGRIFTLSDRLGTERVVIVSRTLASRLWPSGSPVGQQLRVLPPANATNPTMTTYRVVGVVGDIRHSYTDADLADVYVPLLQWPSPGVFTYTRVQGDGAIPERELRSALASIDPDVALGATRRLATILDLQRAGSRALAWLLVVFAAFAALLALVGIYGVIAYTIRQAEREIAVRLAIGASRRAIMRLFVFQGARVLAAGIAIGCAGAIALGQVLRAQLFNVSAVKPEVIVAVSVGFAVCGLIAIIWPASSAASLDPARALRD